MSGWYEYKHRMAKLAVGCLLLAIVIAWLWKPLLAAAALAGLYYLGRLSVRRVRHMRRLHHYDARHRPSVTL